MEVFSRLAHAVANEPMDSLSSSMLLPLDFAVTGTVTVAALLSPPSEDVNVEFLRLTAE